VKAATEDGKLAKVSCMLCRPRLVVLLLALVGSPAFARADAPAATERVQVTVDTSQAPEAAAFAAEAKKLIIKWHPIIAEALKSPGFVPPARVTLVMKPGIKPPAYTSGSRITVNADYIKRHPDDYGMVAHELTHVIQRYPRGNKEAGWLVEGIADYVRFYLYEPQTKLRPPNPAKAKYQDGYRTAAQFLAWIERNRSPEIIRKLNTVLRQGRYTSAAFKTYTGKSLDDLWDEFVSSLPTR
jgi:Peptidase of plants and bacteria